MEIPRALHNARQILPSLRDAVRAIGAAAAAGALSLPLVSEGASIDAPIGPIEAQITLVDDPHVTVDLSVLGKAHSSVSLPFGYGLDIKPEPLEFDGDIMAGFADSLISGKPLTEAETMALLGDPVGDINDAGRGLAIEIAKGGLRASAVALAGYLALGYGRRRFGENILGPNEIIHTQEHDPEKPPILSRRVEVSSVLFGGTALLMVPLLVAGVSSVASAAKESLDPDNLIAGVEFEGDIPEGLQEHLPKLLEVVSDFVRESNQFYDSLSINLEQTLEDFEIEKSDGDRVAVIYADNHGNAQMIPLIRRVAEHVDADVILSLGDETGTGHPEEARLLARQWEGNQIPLGIALGNHDSAEVGAVLNEEAGFRVLQGEAIEVGGFRVIGDTDPRQTLLFAPNAPPRRDESPLDTANRLVEDGCLNGAEILIAHDLDDYPELSTDPVGCGISVFGGHMHPLEADPVFVMDQMGRNMTVQLPVIESSTGATLNMLRFGRLNSDAGVWVIKYNANGSANAYNVRLHTDGGVQISSYSPELIPAQNDGSETPDPNPDPNSEETLLAPDQLSDSPEAALAMP